MKKRYLSRMTILSVFLFSFLFIAGCGGSDDGIVNTHVIVQLQTAGSNYLVDGMTVSIQKAGGSVVLTGVTGTNGTASIPVTQTGDYNVIQVEGVDSTTLAEGSETGREFVKSNPIANPYPNLTYTFGGIFPIASVTVLGSDYTVNAPVPSINKVTVLKMGSSVSNTSGTATVAAGTAAFAGRVIMSNLSFNDAYCVIGIWSSDSNGNRVTIYENATVVSGGDFWVTSPFSDTSIGTMAYAFAGPIYFEAPGTDSGDWALGYNLSSTDLKTRGNYGGNVAKVNFLQFNGGVGNDVLQTSNNGSGSVPHNYSFDYRIFQFAKYL